MSESELDKQYTPSAIEAKIIKKWNSAKAYQAQPDGRKNRFVVMMPLPNVTGALHMGHALDNTMQDLLTRWHRMKGDNSLWMPGTDHAGISTQAVVERRLLELEGKTRHDLGREKLVERIWSWKDEYQKRIISQQQAMAASCDWDRQRFTMDAICSRAVRVTFLKMFSDDLIYRGDRLINWDCKLQTAVADDEIYYEKVKGNFYYIKYKVISPKAGEPSHLMVATTRPETMLGDTAVAVHPNPEAALKGAISKLEEQMAKASGKDKELIAKDIEAIKVRLKDRLAEFNLLVKMAKDGRKVELPLIGREIPIIADEWAKPELGTGCVKLTPAHDFNDYEVWKRHKAIGTVKMLDPTGVIAAGFGPYSGLPREEARKKIVADLKSSGALHDIEDRDIDLAYSDRSKTVIEPFLSKQWFVRMHDVPSGIKLGRGTKNEFNSPGLAQAAIDATLPNWKSPTGRHVQFWPDPVRYGGTYRAWLGEKRDWCISRQLWWGHQIPVWAVEKSKAEGEALAASLKKLFANKPVFVRLSEDGIQAGSIEVQLCSSDESLGKEIESHGLKRDPDVLDTWFSSAIWPLSTLGWPDPETAEVLPGQLPTKANGGFQNTFEYYYPTSTLVTGRDIITLWVARMVVMGLYLAGDVPFTDVFLHATILDGKGERMSKSKGNGVDPVDIIERYGADAMRYVLCDMETGTQDIRLPVQAISPFTGELIDLATAKHGRTIFSYLCPKSGKEFDVLGTLKDVPPAKVVSDRFEIGRNFCNKLWNSARFAFMNLSGHEFKARKFAELSSTDRWILGRLQKTITAVESGLAGYHPSVAVNAARDFFWNDLCDWYLEMSKPVLRVGGAEAAATKQVLAVVLDNVLRLLHPFIPLITEEIWEKLNALTPKRGVVAELPSSELLIKAAWPKADDNLIDEKVDNSFAKMQELVRVIRDLRMKNNVPLGKKVVVNVKTDAAHIAQLKELHPIISTLAGLESLSISSDAKPGVDAAVAVSGAFEIYLEGAIDREKEKVRLTDQHAKLSDQIGKLRVRLENQDFISRAKPEIIAKHKKELEVAEAELVSVVRSLERLT